MLKFHYLYEDYDLAARALSLWMRGDARKALDWYRISANATYAVRVPEGGMRFLRMAPEGEKRVENLRAESEYLAYITKNGYPAANMLPSLGGSTVEMLEYKGEIWYASLFEGVPGERSDRVKWTEEMAFAYGAELARLHRLSREYSPQTRVWSYEDVLARATDSLKRCGAKPETLAAVAKLEKALAGIPRSKENYGLLHCDYEPDNVFFEGGKPYIIDFESGMYYFYAYDVHVALNALEDAVAEDALPLMRKTLLEGYESVLPLDRDMLGREDVGLFHEARGASELLRCLADPAKADEPEWATNLRGRLAGAARECEEELIAWAAKA